MLVIATIAELSCQLTAVRRSGRAIGFVPTMGVLHAGHGALLDRARREPDFLVASIFVNPLQFDRREDYDAYRVNLPEDLEFCRARGADLVFTPSPEEMYPQRQQTFVEVEGLSDLLCGKFRAGHFRAVATVVAKLFHIVQPDRVYFGEKDAQQLAVIRRMVADLNLPIEIVPVATVREADGLALSSRNRRLSEADREVAPVLYQALRAAYDQIATGVIDAAQVRTAALQLFEPFPQVRVEYFEIVDPLTLTSLNQIEGPVKIAVAAWVGGTRLIDNL